MPKPFYKSEDRRKVLILLPVAVATVGVAVFQFVRPKPFYYDRPDGLSRDSEASLVTQRFIREEDDRQYLWARGPKDADSPEAEWFDMTGSPLPLDKFEHGIGKDTIPAIDDPVFVKADDPRLAAFWRRRGLVDLDRLPVIGFEHNGVARAYPRPLLDSTELVNDTVGGKPVTIGW